MAEMTPFCPVLRRPASPAQSLLPERDAVHKHGADRGGAGTGLLLTLQCHPGGWGMLRGWLGQLRGPALPSVAFLCGSAQQSSDVAAPSHP